MSKTTFKKVTFFNALDILMKLELKDRQKFKTNIEKKFPDKQLTEIIIKTDEISNYLK